MSIIYILLFLFIPKCKALYTFLHSPIHTLCNTYFFTGTFIDIYRKSLYTLHFTHKTAFKSFKGHFTLEKV